MIIFKTFSKKPGNCLSAIRFQRKKRKSASDITYRCDYNRDIILTFPFIDDFYNLFMNV